MAHLRFSKGSAPADELFDLTSDPARTPRREGNGLALGVSLKSGQLGASVGNNSAGQPG